MNHEQIKNILIEAGKAVRQNVMHNLSVSSTQVLSQVHAEKKEDTIYEIDRQVEEHILKIIEPFSGTLGGFVLLAEGIGDSENGIVLPAGNNQPSLRILMDPIDGTRGLMYDKRSAFFLAGAAPNKGSATSLSDIEVAVMIELPTTRQYQSDVLWAIKGKGSFIYRENMLTGEVQQKTIAPSNATSIIGGFAQLARFFPPGREVLAAIEDELIHALLPSNPSEKALVFEDQYISSGGQLYELLMGHDRFIADLRGLLYNKLRKEGKQGGHVCHPYDVCAHLIGQEAGIIITNGAGNPLQAPLNLSAEINWIGYANEAIEHEVKPVLMKLLKKYRLTE